MYIHSLESITRISDGAVIPLDPQNRDYQSVLAWVQAGNVVAPRPPKSKARELAELDTANALTPRELRDVILALAGPGNQNHPVVRKVRDAEAAAEVIRGRP